MPVEIERRFIIAPRDIRRLELAGAEFNDIEQGYLNNDPASSVRVRLIDDSTGFLTVKGPKINGAGLEFEYEIPVTEARQILAMTGLRLRKRRYRLPWGSSLIELDFFDLPCGHPLFIAEVELDRISADFTVPDWFGPEITDNSRFSNLSLAQAAIGMSDIESLFTEKPAPQYP